MSEVRALVESDRDWLEAVWTTAERDIGSWGGVGSRAWYFFWKDRPAREFWVGIEPHAFAHYRMRKRDHVYVLDEIVVTPSARRRGYGKQLIKHIGPPLRLKTDARNAAANAFYQGLGFLPQGTYPAKSNPNRMLCAYLLR